MKARKHAELIKAWADGAEIQVKMNDGNWADLSSPQWWDKDEYRIKPQAPETRMTDQEIFDVERGNSVGTSIARRAIANAAIARAIADGDVVLPGDRAERDMKVAIAVHNACIRKFVSGSVSAIAIESVDLQSIIGGVK